MLVSMTFNVSLMLVSMLVVIVFNASRVEVLASVIFIMAAIIHILNAALILVN